MNLINIPPYSGYWWKNGFALKKDKEMYSLGVTSIWARPFK